MLDVEGPFHPQTHSLPITRSCCSFGVGGHVVTTVAETARTVCAATPEWNFHSQLAKPHSKSSTQHPDGRQYEGAMAMLLLQHGRWWIVGALERVATVAAAVRDWDRTVTEQRSTRRSALAAPAVFETDGLIARSTLEDQRLSTTKRH